MEYTITLFSWIHKNEPKGTFVLDSISESCPPKKPSTGTLYVYYRIFLVLFLPFLLAYTIFDQLWDPLTPG